MEVSTTFFEKASKEHTEEVLRIVKEFLQLNPAIEHVVVATTEGTVGET